jgi:hypothetical protein
MSLLTRCTVPATVATTSSPSANVPWPLHREMSHDPERSNCLPHELQRRGYCLTRCYDSFSSLASHQLRAIVVVVPIHIHCRYNLGFPCKCASFCLFEKSKHCSRGRSLTASSSSGAFLSNAQRHDIQHTKYPCQTAKCIPALSAMDTRWAIARPG